MDCPVRPEELLCDAERELLAVAKYLAMTFNTMCSCISTAVLSCCLNN